MSFEGGERTSRQRKTWVICKHKGKNKHESKQGSLTRISKNKATRKDERVRTRSVHNNDETFALKQRCRRRTNQELYRKQVDTSRHNREKKTMTRQGQGQDSRLKSQPNPHVGENKEAHGRSKKIS